MLCLGKSAGMEETSVHALAGLEVRASYTPLDAHGQWSTSVSSHTSESWLE